MTEEAQFIILDDDPLGIGKVSLPGSPPSLQVEAEIAVRQWASRQREEEEVTIEQEFSEALRARIEKLKTEERQASSMADDALDKLEHYRYVLKSVRKEIERLENELSNSPWWSKSYSFNDVVKG